jgi:hypothetical protein
MLSFGGVDLAWMGPAEQLHLGIAHTLVSVGRYTRVVVKIEILHAQRPGSHDLGDVFVGSGPVEMPSVAGEKHDAARRVGDKRIRIELRTDADIEGFLT